AVEPPSTARGMLTSLVVGPTLRERIVAEQPNDRFFCRMKELSKAGRVGGFAVASDGALVFEGRFCLIRGKYYPSYYRAKMERQFLALRQGTRSVDEYEREFTRLGAFVPDLVSTEAKRAHRFTNGLLPAVRHNIVGHLVQTYACTVAIAQEVDASIRREAISTSAQPVAQPPAQPNVAQPSKNQKKRKFRTTLDERRTRHRQIPTYPTCGKRHRRECLVGQNICFFCRQPGHISPNCPERLQQQPQQRQPLQQPQQQHLRQQPPRPQQQPRRIQQARVFAVDQREADQHPGTMSGMIILNNVPVYALFDTGATHSFISRRCLKAIGVHSLTTINPPEVSLASGRKILTDARATDLSLSIGGRILTTDAYVIEMRDFDLILGIDWLTRSHADIQCHDREITLYLPRDDQITYFGSRTRTLPH
ncbi:Unknown protein, partial [Striga hermonthica]